jgi:hypothetical protein
MPNTLIGARTSVRLVFAAGACAVALSSLVPAPASAADRAYPPTPVPDRVVLNPTVTPERSQTFSWRTAGEVGDGRVEVHAEAGGPTITVPSTVGAEQQEGAEGGSDYRVRHHTATVTGLDPDVRYRYRVGSDAGWTVWRTFTTAAADGARPWRWLYFGDAQNGLHDRWPVHLRRALDRVPDAQLALHAGDLVNHPTHDVEWGDWFAAQEETLATTNTLATAGNHEYLYGTLESVDTSARRFRSHFRHPANGPSADDNLAYYADYQDVRFVSLSTGLGIDLLALERQKQWLRDVLERNTRKWTVVMFHYPVYSAGISGSGLARGNPQVRAAWGPVLEEHDVDLVLQGHDHAYSRGFRTANGPAYVVSVLGPKYYDLTSETDNDWVANGAVRVAAAQETSTFQAICMNGDRLTYESIVAAKGERSSTTKQVGETLDAFTIDRSGPRKRVIEGGRCAPSETAPGPQPEPDPEPKPMPGPLPGPAGPIDPVGSRGPLGPVGPAGREEAPGRSASDLIRVQRTTPVRRTQSLRLRLAPQVGGRITVSARPRRGASFAAVRSVRRTVKAKRSTTIELRATSRAKRRLRTGRGLPITVTIRFQPQQGEAVTVRRKATLRR